MTAPVAPVLALLAVLAVATHGLAAEPTLDKWEAARESFTATRERLLAQSLKAIDVAESRARKSSDAVVVERIKRERAAFVEKGIAPRHVALPQWSRGMEAAVTSLKQVAQRTIAALLKDGRDEEAAEVETQLAELLGPPPIPVPVVGGADPRCYWLSQDELNHFRLLSTGDWERYTPRDGKKVLWKEFARDKKSIELIEPNHKVAMQLQSAGANVDYTFDGSEPAQYGGWAKGRWLTAAEVIATLDAEDDATEAKKQAAAKALK